MSAWTISKGSSPEAVAYQASRDAQRLQLLFSFSAAAAVAALLPTLWQADAGIQVLTVSVAFAAWLGFAINFALVLKRLRHKRLGADLGALDDERRSRSAQLAVMGEKAVAARRAA